MKIGRLRLNCDCERIWTHLDEMIKIGGRKSNLREIVVHDRREIEVHDRREIVVQDCHEIVVHDRRAIMAHDHGVILAMNRPSPNQTTMIFRRNFFFKYRCYSLWTLTFDRFLKQLSEFKGKSWVHHDFPVFRLDRDSIKAGFVVINRQIWSNFPLEHRTSAEEEIKPIFFNLRELKPNLRGNRVTSEVWSIIWQ